MMRGLTHRSSMRFWAGSFAATLVAAAWLHPMPTANAQAQRQGPSATEQSENIPDQKLDAAAAAIERMASIKQDYQQRLQKVTSPAEQDRLVEEGNNAMQKAVTDQGLSVAEYDSILVVAQNNPAVRDKIIDRMKARDGSTGSAPKQ